MDREDRQTLESGARRRRRRRRTLVGGWLLFELFLL